MKLKRPTGYGSLAVIVAILVIFLVLEGLARALLSYESQEPVIPTNIGRFDETLGWSKIPMSHGISNRLGYPIEYRINSKGLRDNETPYEKPEGVFRIVLLGDSLAFGFGVPIEKHFSFLLEGYFEDVEVINMGIDGFGVDQELIYLRSEGFRYQPDLVIAYVPHYAEHRHMHTERFGKNKPRFILTGGELKLINSPVKDNTSIRPSGVLRDIDYWLVNRSVAYQLLHNGLLVLVRNAASPQEQRQQDAQNSLSDQYLDELYALGEAIVFAMHDDASEKGAAFVLVTRVNELHAAAIARRVPSLDVSQPLANPRFSLPQNLKHINEAGNGVLAWQIAQYLQQTELIPARHFRN